MQKLLDKYIKAWVLCVSFFVITFPTKIKIMHN
jgi:hypothetical protein